MAPQRIVFIALLMMWSFDQTLCERFEACLHVVKKSLYVSTDGTAGPYIMVPVSQLDVVRRLLDSRRIGYWVEENAISLDGAPEVAVINLGRGGDAAAVQAVLDSVR